MLTKISADLHYAECINLSEQFKQKFFQNKLTLEKSKFAEPKYRIFVNSDLLTERSIYWDFTSQYLRENIVVELEPGIHTLRIDLAQGKGEIVLENVKFHNINNIDLNYLNKTTLEFKLT